MKKDRHYKLGDNFIKMAPDQLIKLNRWVVSAIYGDRGRDMVGSSRVT